jgi:preprotein translocase subunit SecA
MINLLKKLFGTKHDKDVKLLRPIVDEINLEFEKLSGLSDDELCAKTNEFKQFILSQIAELNQEAAALNQKLHDEPLTHEEHEEIYARLAQIEKEEYTAMSEALDELLPQAFAVVKEVCRRLTERKHTYDVVNQSVTWAMVPYDVQLIGGIVIHQGKISEMATGEGKTLVAVAPMYLNALTGRGVHLVTVNDYLARRDCEWMKPVFDFLGIEVGAIQSQQTPEERKELYLKEITYGTNNEFGFDYLRDNMVTDVEEMVQRPHFFAIVDEVDSVLIDEARTPLIISGAVGHTADQRFDQMNPRVKRVVEAQSRLTNSIISEAERLLKSEKKEDRIAAGVAILRTHRGTPKQKRLAKLLQEPEYQKLMRETELEYLRDQGTKMSVIDEELYYTIDERNHQIDITEKGRELLAGIGGDTEMFVIPDIAAELSVIEGNRELVTEDRQNQKDEAMRLYSERSDTIHTISQILRAYSLYERDVEYVVDDGKIKIVDEFTGRILEGRRYSDGLHQAIETKEGVAVEKDTQTLATVTLQNYFRLYKKLAGMTGTAETEAAEFEKIYNLDVVVIPTNKTAIRKDLDDFIYRTKREKYNAVVVEVQRLVTEGRSVLVGTTNVEVSEILSKMLRRANIAHNVLNAKQHQREAEIVSLAGKRGTVTIATNMAGRGTDIKLDSDVRNAGGLAIVGTERHEARRIDRQLRGRSGRQGDPGSSQFFISLEDDLMRLFGGARIAGVMQRLKVPEGEPIQAGLVTKSVENAQKKVEENNFGIRKRLLEYDNVMNQQREAIYTLRRQVLKGERMKGELFSYVENLAHDWFENFHDEGNLEAFKDAVRTTLLCEVEIDKNEFRELKADDCAEKVLEAAKEFYGRKEEKLGVEFTTHIERVALLQTIDEKWREHLVVMDDLKEGIHLRAYGQKDPLLEYKGEAVRIFQQLIREIQKEAVNFAFKFFPQFQVQEERPQQRRAPQNQRKTDNSGLPQLSSVTVTNSSSLRFSRPTTTPVYHTSSEQEEAQSNAIKTVHREEPKIGRNDLCYCGSGKKYKQCHGRTSAAAE